MGVCFALAVFGGELSIDYLDRFLKNYTSTENNKLKYDFWDEHHLQLAISALYYLDGDLGAEQYRKFYVNSDKTHNLKIPNNSFKKIIDFSDRWLR